MKTYQRWWKQNLAFQVAIFWLTIGSAWTPASADSTFTFIFGASATSSPSGRSKKAAAPWYKCCCVCAPSVCSWDALSSDLFLKILLGKKKYIKCAASLGNLQYDQSHNGPFTWSRKRSRHLATIRYRGSRHVHILRLRMRSLALFLRCCWQILAEESTKQKSRIGKDLD